MLSEKTRYAISPTNDSTLAVELTRTGLTRYKKHILSFEDFRGEFVCVGDKPEDSHLQLVIGASSLMCRAPWWSTKKQEQLSLFIRDNVLAASQYPEIKFQSSSVARKPIRGLVVKGTLKIRGTARNATLNIVLNQTKPDIMQIDGDATLRLTDFGIEPPSWFLGLIKIKDEILIRLLLWGARSV